MKRKYPSLDLIRIISEWESGDWNQMLTKCLVNQDMEKLRAVMYGLQAGMDLAAKQKLNTNKLSELFLRMTRSLEITAKKILAQKFPCLMDQPNLMKNMDLSKLDITQHVENKRKRDLEFLKFMEESRF